MDVKGAQTPENTFGYGVQYILEKTYRSITNKTGLTSIKTEKTEAGKDTDQPKRID